MAWDEAKYIINKVLSGIKTNQITGVPPQNMSDFSVSQEGEEEKINIKCRAPENTIIEDQLICTVKGVQIVRKEGSAPILPSDGKLIADIPVGEEFEYVDENVKWDVEYFYGFFPYSDHGVFNYNDFNVKSIMLTEEPKYKIWGFDQNFSDKNPSTTITYPNDVENANYKPMMTNEGNGETTAGDWLSFLQEILKNYPFMVKKSGEADYQIDPDNYTKKLEGETSDYNNLTYSGGAFAWLNKIWMKETYSENGELRKVRFSNGAAEGFLPVGFYDFNKQELEGLWIPMSYMDESGRTLIAETMPCPNKTCDQEKDLIDGFSSRAVFLGGPIMNVLRDLEYMMFKTTNIQEAAGYGRCDAGVNEFVNNPVINNAVVKNSNVPGWKGTSDKKTINKYFHSQALGGYQQWLRDPYTITIAGKEKMSAYYEYDLSGEKYIDTGITLVTTNEWWYGSHLISCGNALLGSQPKQENTATSITGLCDGSPYANNSGTRVTTRLGNCRVSLVSGPATLGIGAPASNMDFAIGAAILLLPPVGYAPEINMER